jgi:hypothetical protein
VDANQLMDLVSRYQENKQFISNEETAKVALIIPFIKLLGYDPTAPREVRLEFAADFVQGDGKRLPDRMDFAIFDRAGEKPLIVIEAKPLGTDLRSKSQQLARYLAQMPDLHFGIMTDGCHYQFYGDLESPNVMDPEPFFVFSLEDEKADWAKTAKFLSKFSREAFNAQTLVTDAENSRYRQGMVEKLSSALKAPSEHESFLNWLTADVYKGVRTKTVRERLAEVAKEAIEPALLRVLGDDFLAKLQERIQLLNEPGERARPEAKVAAIPLVEEGGSVAEVRPRQGIETTDEEREFFGVVRDICVKLGCDGDDLLQRDTTNYFNVSYKRPTKWFIRLFSGGRRKSVATWVPVEEARALALGFEVEPAPSAFGVSRIYIGSVPELWALTAVIAKSLEICQGRRDEPQVTDADASLLKVVGE